MFPFCVAAREDLDFIVACLKARGGIFLPPTQTTSGSGQEGSDDEEVDDWTTARTFEKRPASFPFASSSGRDLRKVDELETQQMGKQSNLVMENRVAAINAKASEEGSGTPQTPDSEDTNVAQRDKVLEQMAAIYWKERRDHRLTKQCLEREVREKKMRIDKLEEENDRLLEKIQEIELRELAVLEKEKQMSLTPEEGERRKLEFLYEKLLSLGAMVSEVTHEIQQLKK